MSEELGQILTGLGELKGEMVGVARQPEDGHHRMTRAAEQGNETREISIGTKATVEQLVAKVAEQNGRIGKGERRADRLEERIDALVHAGIRADERAAVKAEARASVASFGKRIWATVEKPVLYALAFGILAGSAWSTERALGLLQW